MGRKIWNVIPYDKQKAARLARECEADDFAVLLLTARGFDTAEKITDFLYSAERELSSPFLLKDMEKATERIFDALENGEKILIYGDYDADGVTATALLYSYFTVVGADVHYYIPSRLNEGYGLSLEAAQMIKELGVQLVITVDNGIAAFKEAEFFKANGIDLIVTDHHQVGDTLPQAVAVIDPHRADDMSPCKDLAGVGVAMKLAAALEGGDYSFINEAFSDLVCLGTIADIVPLTGENRSIVCRGLENMKNCDRTGLRCLMNSVFSGKRELSSTSVAFGIAPRINAAGRMDSAKAAIELLLCEDENEAARLVDEINSANSLRQSVETDILTEALSLFEKEPERTLDRVLVAAGKGWHPGVIGIVASRLVEKYGKPALVISIDENGEAKGSGRSIEGFSLYEALSYCSDILEQFGGHTQAAGFSVKSNKIEALREKINIFADKNEDVFPSLTIDCRLNPAAISSDIFSSLDLLEPFGAFNPVPLFGLFGMTVTGIKSIGSNKHIRVSLSKANQTVAAVWFGQTADTFPYKEGDVVDAAVRLEKNEYMGQTKVSIQIKDMRPADEEDIGLFRSLRSYEDFVKSVTYPLAHALNPSRELLARVYKYIREAGSACDDAEILCMRLGEDYSKAGAVKVSLDALSDVGVLTYKDGVYHDARLSTKADLTKSPTLRKFV